jgi:type IV pilus assembly protein PilA
MTRTRTAFTLIELLIVVVIIGILAAIAIPKYAETKAKAYEATLKSDLRDLVTAQEAYFDINATYTTSMPTTSFQASQGVTYLITAADATGWSGTATHVGLVGYTPSGCHIAVGAAESTAGEDEGAPYCP